MTKYEEFQRIMVELNFKRQTEENHKNFGINCDLPPGFEQLFNRFKK